MITYASEEQLYAHPFATSAVPITVEERGESCASGRAAGVKRSASASRQTFLRLAPLASLGRLALVVSAPGVPQLLSPPRLLAPPILVLIPYNPLALFVSAFCHAARFPQDLPLLGSRRRKKGRPDRPSNHPHDRATRLAAP